VGWGEREKNLLHRQEGPSGRGVEALPQPKWQFPEQDIAYTFLMLLLRRKRLVAKRMCLWDSGWNLWIKGSILVWF
jgi:hypothetical protein